MAQAVAQVIEEKRHLMVEAGTGVGKSFAYLVPAILAAAESGKRVVVSTRTINLQEQLVNIDVPFLTSVMPQECKAVLVKGRRQYVSIRRLKAARERFLRDGSLHEDTAELAALGRWAGRTEDGSLSSLGYHPPSSVWDAVQSDSGNCLKQACPHYRECFFFRAARKAWSANLLIVNHSLYLSDVALRAQGGTLLPDHDVVIFDEAHDLAKVAAQHLGLRIASGDVANQLNALYNDRKKSGLLAFHRQVAAQKQVIQTLHVSDAFFDAVRDWKNHHGESNGRVRVPLPLPDRVVNELNKLAIVLHDGISAVNSAEQRIELEAARNSCRRFARDLSSWLTQGDPQNVYWIESKEDRKSIVLAGAPPDVGLILRREIFERVSSCVLTSATLAVGPPSRKMFLFSRSRLGVRDIATLHLGSPFDFRNKAKVYIRQGLPDPSGDDTSFEDAVLREIPTYVSRTQGKALVLFSSYRMLDRANTALGPWFRKAGIKLLVQSDEHDRSKLIDAFKADVNSVLFGTDSFWQGVDVPGEALSNVIITRLPFGRNVHPLREARREAIEQRGGNAFKEDDLPEAVLKFKQGIGRLIRSHADEGIIVILDSRILWKSYGEQFLGALPTGIPVIVE